jgi:FkbM family methyltransferase
MSPLLKIATFIWNITPSHYLKEKYFSAYCWLVRGKKRIINIDGVNLKLDLSQTIDVAVFLGRFEREVVAAIDLHTRTDDIILDIGANAGVHALAFAKRAYQSGKVYAFEPTDYAFGRLVENIGLNPQLYIEAFKIALSNENIESKEIDFRSSWRTDGVIDKRRNCVSFVRLDDWISKMNIKRVDIIKLDVDGFEYSVLHGAVETVKKYLPTFFMEVGLYHFEDKERNPVFLLSEIGYKYWDAKTKALHSPSSLQSYLSAPAMLGTTLNIIASAHAGFKP